MRNLLLFVLVVMTSSWSSPKPMEPLDHYNVVLVHGAADICDEETYKVR